MGSSRAFDGFFSASICCYEIEIGAILPETSLWQQGGLGLHLGSHWLPRLAKVGKAYLAVLATFGYQSQSTFSFLPPGSMRPRGSSTEESGTGDLTGGLYSCRLGKDYQEQVK